MDRSMSARVTTVPTLSMLALRQAAKRATISADLQTSDSIHSTGLGHRRHRAGLARRRRSCLVCGRLCDRVELAAHRAGGRSPGEAAQRHGPGGSAGQGPDLDGRHDPAARRRRDPGSWRVGQVLPSRGRSGGAAGVVAWWWLGLRVDNLGSDLARATRQRSDHRPGSAWVWVNAARHVSTLHSGVRGLGSGPARSDGCPAMRARGSLPGWSDRDPGSAHRTRPSSGAGTPGAVRHQRPHAWRPRRMDPCCTYLASTRPRTWFCGTAVRRCGAVSRRFCIVPAR